jgi:hypothetical protein
MFFFVQFKYILYLKSRGTTGSIHKPGSAPSHVQQTTLVIYNQDKVCQGLISTKYCAKDTHKNSNACSGDSGLLLNTHFLFI